MKTIEFKGKFLKEEYFEEGYIFVRKYPYGYPYEIVRYFSPGDGVELFKIKDLQTIRDNKITSLGL